MSKTDFWIYLGTTVLSLVFIFLQVQGIIDWPWYWLVSPVWALAGLYLACYAVVIVLFFLDVSIHGHHD